MSRREKYVLTYYETKNYIRSNCVINRFEDFFSDSLKHIYISLLFMWPTNFYILFNDYFLILLTYKNSFTHAI